MLELKEVLCRCHHVSTYSQQSLLYLIKRERQIPHTMPYPFAHIQEVDALRLALTVYAGQARHVAVEPVAAEYVPSAQS